MALSPAGLFSCSRLRGTQEAHVNTGCMWALAKVRGTCSGGSMSRKLANTEWIGLRPVRANQTHANTKTEAQFPPHSIFSFSRSPPHAIFSFFVSGCCCYGTTAALEAFPVLTATNGASSCGLVILRACARGVNSMKLLSADLKLYPYVAHHGQVPERIRQCTRCKMY